MAAKKIRLASILLGLVMALCLAPGLAIAESPDSGAEGNGMQTAANKPLQAIQAAYMPSFITDTGKNLNAKVVEGNGALSYAVKSGGDCVSVDSNGALTFSKAGKAIVTVTAAATNEYAETSIDVPITIYDHFDYTFTVGNTLDCVDYYGRYPINKLEIKLKGWENVLGSGTINSPQRGSKTTISATGFAKRIEMKAEIQMRNRTRSASKTLDLNGGGRFEIEMSSRGTIVMCDYGITLPEPDYVAPVAKPNLSSNGQNQLLIYPGSVLSGGQHMEYTFGTATEPNQNGWTDNYGFMRAKDPGDYYVWWKTASRDRRSLMYFSGGRLDTAPQCMKVTIGKGNINPTVSIDGWTYGETAKTPTVTGNTGNGEVTYEYKAKNAGDNTYSATVPTDAGDYTVRATIDETTTHNGGSATADFAIAKATTPDQDVRVVGVMSSNDAAQAWETSVSQSLAGMMPANAGTLSYQKDGAPKYKDGETVQDLPEGFKLIKYEVNGTSGEVNATLQVTKEAAGTIEQVGEIILPVKVTSAHYNDATINVVLVPTARTEMTVAISGVPDDRTKTFGDESFTLTATAKNKDTGTEAQTQGADWYWYSSDPSVLEVSEQGGNPATVTVKGAGSAQIMAWYEPNNSAQPYIGAAVTESITVNKTEFTPSVTIVGWTYGGKPSTPVVNGNPGKGTPTYEYKAADADDSTYTATVPTLAGTYTVRATVPETANYKSASCTKDFTIAKKPITATVTAHDKTYDGTTNATVTATVEKSDLVESDIDSAALVEDGKVAISGVTCTFEDEVAGEDKAVGLDYSGVVSPVANAECYEVTVAATPTAAIKPLAVNVGAANQSSPYGQDIVKLEYGIYGPNGLVEGDTLESLGVTATTEATKTKNVGYYPITLSIPEGQGNPNYDVTFGGDATYTITKADPVVTEAEAPKAANPTYNGSPQALVTAGTVEGGEIQYSLDGKTFSANMPVGTDAGDYPVWYKVVGDANHNDLEPQQLTSTIAKATVPPQVVRVVGLLSSTDTEWVTTKTQPLAGMMPSDAGTSNYTAGDPVYKVGGITPPDGVKFTSSVGSSSGVVTAEVKIPLSAKDIPEGAQEITVPVTVAFEKNYNEAVINVVMVPTRKKEMTVAISGVPKSVVFGGADFTLTATAKDKDSGAEVQTNNGGWYWYSSDPGVLEVSDQGGNSATVTVKSAGSAQIMAWYEPNGGNAIGAAVTDSIMVNKAAIEPSVTIAGWTYGGAANAPVLSGNAGNGTVAYSYSGTTAGGAPFGPSAAPPAQAGSYIVTATVAETANYKGATCTAGFAVAKKPITATVTAEDKTYDGTTNATVTATVDANDLAPSDLDKDTPVEGGKVEILGLAGTFADKNVGEDKAVGLDYSGVVSPVAKPANYDVTISRAPTATITPRPVSVRADDKSSRYGEAIAALTYSLYDSTTLAEGDTLESLGVTASTTATSSSNVGEYPIALSGGTSNGNYEVTLGEDGTYTIAKADPAVTAPKATNPAYSGKPQALVGAGSAEGGTMQYSLDGKAFSANIPTATAAGSYTVWYRVVGDANHNGAGARSVAAAIGKIDISKAKVALAQTSFTYDGKAKTPAVKSVTVGGKTLVGGTDYTVSYSNNVNSGIATVTVTGKGNYAGTAKATFTIKAAPAPKPAPAPVVRTVDMHRMYNPNSGEHFYTASIKERDTLIGLGWNYEGIGWVAPETSKSPVYRLYNPNSGDHHYTLAVAERDNLIGLGWNYEGVGWYSDDAKGTPLYRQFNPNAVVGTHNYTTSKAENDHLASIGWRPEGIAWHGVKAASAASAKAPSAKQAGGPLAAATVTFNVARG